jgi:epoxyqueuosine reductase
MSWLERPDAVSRRGELARTLPGIRSVIVVGHEYYQKDPPGVPEDSSRGVIARYARGRDYHKVVKRKLVALGKWLEHAAARVGATAVPTWRAYVDTGPILERELGQRAGLGWLGKNTMLIHPRKGSYFFLGVLLTDQPLDPDEPFTADFCGSCTACLDACPTGALLGRDADGAPVMDAARCISYLTIEHKGEIAPELRSRMGNRIYGCDICQEVCPWNEKFAKVADERAYTARNTKRSTEETPTTDGPDLGALLRMSEDAWDAYTRGSAMRRAGYVGLRRNVTIAVGNWLAASEAPDAAERGTPS